MTVVLIDGLFVLKKRITLIRDLWFRVGDFIIEGGEPWLQIAENLAVVG
jgi:hypothetical protein